MLKLEKQNHKRLDVAVTSYHKLVLKSYFCLNKTHGPLTLQEVQLTSRRAEADEVEASGGPAAAPLGPPGRQALEHAALAGSVQAEHQHLTLPGVLFLLPAGG